MNNKQKTIRDYTLVATGGMATAIGAAFVVAELPALLLTAGGVLLAGKALNNMKAREDAE